MAATYTQNAGLHKFVAAGPSETLNSIILQESRGLAMTIQCQDGGGGFTAGTVTIQVSQDGTSWITAKDILGAAVTFTAEGIVEISTGSKYVRGVTDASITDIDLFISIPA